jgi:hypothetical protein
MDQELIAYLDARFRETSQQIADLRVEVGGLGGEFESFRQDTAQRFEKLEAEIQYAHIKVGNLPIRLLAEGVVSFEEKLQAFRAEVKQEFDETRGLMRSAYGQVDHRLLSLESFKARKDRDPIELIRELYGKTKTPG